MATLKTFKDINDWLSGQSKEVFYSVAARSALRSLAIISENIRPLDRVIDIPILMSFSVGVLLQNMILSGLDDEGVLSKFMKSYRSPLQVGHRINARAVRAIWAAGRALAEPASFDPQSAISAISTSLEVPDTPRLAAAFIREMAADCDAIDLGPSSVEMRSIALELLNGVLWPEGIPEPVMQAWTGLRASLELRDEHWEVWTNWYDSVLNGGSLPNNELPSAIARFPRNWRRQLPAVVNARIKEFVAGHTVADVRPAEGIPASHALDQKSLQHWLGTQPPEVARTLACRAGLRALPLLVALWGRPDFRMLPFFRAAQSAWTRANYPDVRRTGVPLRNLAENSAAGAALMLAEASALVMPRNDTSEFAARAIASAYSADEVLADPSLEEVMSIEAVSDFSARAELAVRMANDPLWKDAPPQKIRSDWVNLQRSLLTDNDAEWEVWISWYNERLLGEPTLGKSFNLAVATLPDELWQQEPKAINTRIKELIAEHTRAEPILPRRTDHATDPIDSDGADGPRRRRNGRRAPASGSRAFTTKIGAALFENKDQLNIQLSSMLVLIDEKLETLASRRPNSDEARKELEEEKLEYTTRRASVEKLRRAIDEFGQGAVEEDYAVKEAKTFAQGIRAWWSRDHKKICAQGYNIALFLGAVAICRLFTADPLTTAVVGVLVGGKPIVEGLRNLATFVRGPTRGGAADASC